MKFSGFVRMRTVDTSLFSLYDDQNGTLATVYKCRGFYQKTLQLQSQCIREGKYMTTDEMKKLIERYMNQVYQFCCYLTGNRQEAEDLCQDTFVTFVEKRRTVLFKEERENKNYLLGIAANHWKNQRRKMWRRAEVNEELEEEQWNWICSEHNIEQELLEVERNRALQKAIYTLPDSQRLVIQMMYSGDMTANEIATTLHISQNTVKSRLRLAKEKLRKIMEEQGYEV